jgi:hypothetical protein
VSDPEPLPFNPEKPHDDWGRLGTAYELAPFTAGPPVAIQVILKSGERVLQTGVLAGTEDLLATDGKPRRSVIYFVHAEGVVVNWTDVLAVLAMVAETAEEEPNG